MALTAVSALRQDKKFKNESKREARFGLEASVTIKEEKGHRLLPWQQQKRLSLQIRLYFKIQVCSLKIVRSNLKGSLRQLVDLLISLSIFEWTFLLKIA